MANSKEWEPIGTSWVEFNNLFYDIYEEDGDYEGRIECNANTIAIDGETVGLERERNYMAEGYGDETGYVVEVIRTDKDNVFKLDRINLVIEGLGWGETELITDKDEIEYIKCILERCNIELIIE